MDDGAHIENELPASVGEAQSGELFTLYRLRIRGFLRSLGVPDSELGELTQRTQFKFFLSKASFPSDSARDGYVLRVARNVWHDWLKEGQRVVPLEVDRTGAIAGQRESDSRVQEPLAAVLDREREAALAMAMSELPPRMRQCLHLHVVEERSHAEIAALLRINVNTVKSHLGQARVRLRERLGKLFEIPEL